MDFDRVYMILVLLFSIPFFSLLLIRTYSRCETSIDKTQYPRLAEMQRHGLSGWVHFISELYRAEHPGLTISVGQYSWKIHAQELRSVSKFFERIFPFAPEAADDGNITLHDENPILIAYLVLWLYTRQYYELKAVASQDLLLPTIQSIMTLGLDSKSADCRPMLDRYSLEEPESLHAQMYWLADRYQITRLKDDVVAMIEGHLTRLPNAIVPTLKHLLGLSISSAGVIPVRSRCILTAKASQHQAPSVSGPVDCPDGSPSSPTPSDTAIQPDGMDVLAMFFASGRSGRTDMAEELSINPEDDADLWSLLVGKSSEYVLQHADDTAFVAIIQGNPSFQWAILQQFAKGHAKMQGEVTKWRDKAVELQDQVGDLQYEVVKLEAGAKHWPKEVSKWRAEAEEWKMETQRCRSEIRELCDVLEVDQSRNSVGTTRPELSKWSRRRRHERKKPLAHRVSTKRYTGTVGSSQRRLRGSQSRNSASA